MMKSLFGILAVCLLSACGSIRYMDIQTYNPSEITLPGSVSKILMVNNALPQPADIGYAYKLMGAEQDTSRAVADSALFDACRTMGKYIVEANYFDDVQLYHNATRKSGTYYEDTKLTPQQVSSLCEETGTDAVISIDCLLFDMHKDVFNFSGYIMGNIKVDIAGVIRCYLPGRATPVATVIAKDSIFWNESVDNLSLLNLILPDANTALRTAGQYIGAKAHINFVPHWQDETRWYYSGANSRWKDAAVLTSAQRWDKASVLWLEIYNNTKGWKGKARASSNLALCNEMKGDLKKAYEWASTSYDLFKTNTTEEEGDTKLLKLYMETLTNRIRSDKKLNMQFGEE